MPVTADALLSVDPNRIYTDDETAVLLGAPKRKVRVLINGGQLHGFRIGKIYRVQGQAILEFARGGGWRRCTPALTPPAGARRDHARQRDDAPRHVPVLRSADRVGAHRRGQVDAAGPDA